MVQTIRKKGPVHLRFDGGKVFITPEDHSRFSMAAEQVVKILQKERANEELYRQFDNHYLPFLHAWCVNHADKVSACYLGVPTPHGLTVFLIGRDHYDFALGEEIAKFGIQLEKEGWPSNVLQIPDGEEEDLLTFFNPEISLEVYAEATPASRESRS